MTLARAEVKSGYRSLITMTLTQEQQDDLEKSLGPGPQSGDDAPNGRNFIGALNNLRDIAERMDEYGLTYDDLGDEKQAEFDATHEDLQFHIKKLANVFGSDLVGSDDAIELPNGNAVDLPLQATAVGASSKNLPNDPRGTTND